jgi:hypothetical protein
MSKLLDVMINVFKRYVRRRPALYEATLWILSRKIIASNPIYKMFVMRKVRESILAR